MNRTVLVTTRFFDEAATAFLRERGCEVVTSGLRYDQMDTELPPERLRALLVGATGWIVGTVAVTSDIIAASPGLRIIARRGVGYDNVDTQAARRVGCFVTNTPGGNEPSVADHAVAMMLAVGKRLRDSHERMLGGHWNPLAGTDLFRKTVGLVGLGRIAREVARRVSGFDVEILGHDIAADAGFARAAGITLVDLPTLLARADYVSLHLPLTPGTTHLIDAAALSRMKPTAILVNTARGGLIDDAALLEALQQGRLGGAGLDVFESEADPSRRDVSEALLRCPNVVATPHAAGSSLEGVARANLIAAHAVVDVLDGRKPAAACIVVDQALP